VKREFDKERVKMMGGDEKLVKKEKNLLNLLVDYALDEFILNIVKNIINI